MPRDRTRRTRAVVLDENGTIEPNSLGTTRARGSLRFFYARFLRRDEIFTTKKRGYERARKPERREEWWLYPKREREREMIRFVQIRLRRLARKYSPLSPLRGVPTSNSSTKSLPGHRLRHAVVHQPNRFPNPPIYGRKTSLGRHHRSRRLPTIRLRRQILRVPLLTGRGTRVQGGF